MILQNLSEPYRAPVYGGPRVAVSREATIYADRIEYDVETYKFCGERDAHGSYVMRWENPVPALRKEVAELRAAIKKAKEALSG